MAQQWLHCNECFYQPDKRGLKFYLTNCSHVYCEKCVSSCTKEKCKLCRSQCTALPLSGKIPKQVEEMFTDPFDHLKKHLKTFSQIYEFHKNHQRRILRHFQSKVKRLDAQMGEAKKFLGQAKIMEKEYQKLKKENAYFKSLINKKDCSTRFNSRKSPSGSIYGGGPVMTPKNSQARCGSHGSSGPGGYQQYGNMSGCNIPPGRLLLRSPPGGTMGSGRDYPNIENVRANVTPDSGFEGEDSPPLSVPRPIHFGFSQESN